MRINDNQKEADDSAKEERSFARLQRMGIVAWEQVLLLLPTSHKDYTVVNTFLPANECLYPIPKACYALTVTSQPNKVGIAPPRLSFNVSDSCNSAKLTVFGDIWAWQLLNVGDKIVVEGVIDTWEGHLQVNSPTLVPRSFVGKVMPVYRGKRGASNAQTISSEFVYEKTREALNDCLSKTAQYILSHFQGMDENFLIKRSGINFSSLEKMLLAIHNPTSFEEGQKGLLAAKKLGAFEVIFNAEKQAARKPNPRSVVPIKQADINNLIFKLPFTLTEHQKIGIHEITEDIRSPYPMKRLLSGDVGYGKTDVALIPAIAAQKAGAKVAIMCPSMLIARQWLEKIRFLAPNVPVQVVSAETKIDKSLLPSIPIMLGTTALVTRLPKLKWVPDVVIFDEQQKHGNTHKEILVGQSTNRLDATATCQPKTSALVNYGGMDETILNQCPVEKRIVSRVVTVHEKDRLFAHIKKIIAEIEGAQVAIIYPSVKSGSKTSVIDASQMWEKVFPGQVATLYGSMKDEEKEAVINRMMSGDAKILCSTILIETGLTLPSLRGMLVVSADRFGVSALHQLRGRLARKGGTGYFYMYVENEMQEDTQARLNLVAEITDGFLLAEKDAEMRGYGSLGDDDETQSGISRSSLFFGLRLMPKDIEACLAKA